MNNIRSSAIYSAIPSDWKVISLSKLLRRVKKPVEVEPHRLYREIGILSHGKGIFHKEERTGASLGNKSVYWVEPSCFVVNIVFAWEQAIAKATDAEKGMIASHRFPMYKPKTGTLDLDFLVFFFNTPQGKHLLGLASPGGAGRNKTLGQQAFLDLLIPLPPFLEQRKITDILSTVDRAIALTERRIGAARQRKKGLMQRLLTGRVRFPEFAGRKWQEVQLGNLAEVKRGASPRPIRDPKWFAKSGRGWIRIADVTDSPTRFLNKTSQYLSPLGESKSVKVEIGELIMSICATIGVPKIVNIPACIHDGFVVFRGYGKHLHREFLYHYLNFITERLANRGQPGTQKNLNSTLVRKIRVPKPPLAEQERIAAVLQSCDREIELLTHKRDALQRQKKGLMQRLLTGRVRMKV